MSDITGENPDYTDDDLAILLSGAWNPGEDEEPTPEPDHEPEQEQDQPPANPWAHPQQAESYSQSTTSQPVNATEREDTSRVELQPGGVRAAIEAILAVADRPVTARELSAALIVSEDRIEVALDELYREYNGYDENERVHEPRGFELRRIAGGWRLYARADFGPWVSRFVVGQTSKKLPRAVMETLTVLAYQQPATRGYVASMRGVNVDAAFRTLLKRGLIAEAGLDPETRAPQYVTTDLLLEKLGLNSLDELPPLAPYLPEADDLELSGENP